MIYLHNDIPGKMLFITLTGALVVLSFSIKSISTNSTTSSRVEGKNIQISID